MNHDHSQGKRAFGSFHHCMTTPFVWFTNRGRIIHRVLTVMPLWTSCVLALSPRDLNCIFQRFIKRVLDDRQFHPMAFCPYASIQHSTRKHQIVFKNSYIAYACIYSYLWINSTRMVSYKVRIRDASVITSCTAPWLLESSSSSELSSRYLPPKINWWRGFLVQSSNNVKEPQLSQTPTHPILCLNHMAVSMLNEQR
jgi:hypothetical protein